MSCFILGNSQSDFWEFYFPIWGTFILLYTQESMAKLENTLDGVFDAGDSLVEEQFNKKQNDQKKIVQFSSVV